jgi:uncharacterized SAM-binding protein YcdF (DUF218 family)
MKSVALFLIVLMLWTVGLLAFSARVEKSTPAEEPERAQAIVALTGNATNRITSAVKLLELGKGARLLVSGVNPDVRPIELQSVSKATRSVYECCVDLGFQAMDTKGNARETAAWARKHGYSHLIVVTADYHMPRALLELHGAMPKAEFTPYPVKTEELDAAAWWKTGHSARRMILEYCKYLAVLAREAFLSLGPADNSANRPENARLGKEPAR